PEGSRAALTPDHRANDARPDAVPKDRQRHAQEELLIHRRDRRDGGARNGRPRRVECVREAGQKGDETIAGGLQRGEAHPPPRPPQSAAHPRAGAARRRGNTPPARPLGPPPPPRHPPAPPPGRARLSPTRLPAAPPRPPLQVSAPAARRGGMSAPPPPVACRR